MNSSIPPNPTDPDKRLAKKTALILGTLVFLFAAWWAYDSIKRTLYPPQPLVVDLCDPDHIQQNTTEPRPCRWVIPVKYYLGQVTDVPRLFEARVPWHDIDPVFPKTSDIGILIQFLPNNSRYAASIRFKNNKADKPPPNAKGWMVFDQDIYFHAFDGVEVYVRTGQTTYDMPNPLVRIFRPLDNHGSLHMIVPMPKLQSQEALNKFIPQHLFEVDRKIMQFIAQWH